MEVTNEFHPGIILLHHNRMLKRLKLLCNGQLIYDEFVQRQEERRRLREKAEEIKKRQKEAEMWKKFEKKLQKVADSYISKMVYLQRRKEKKMWRKFEEELQKVEDSYISKMLFKQSMYFNTSMYFNIQRVKEEMWKKIEEELQKIQPRKKNQKIWKQRKQNIVANCYKRLIAGTKILQNLGKGRQMKPMLLQSYRKNIFTEKIIGQGGGHIIMPGCEISIPSGALDEKTNLQFELLRPENLGGLKYMTVTPTLKCGPPGTKFKKNITIRTKTLGNDCPGEVVIFCKESDQQNAYIHSKSHVQNSVIEFETNHFTKFEGASAEAESFVYGFLGRKNNYFSVILFPQCDFNESEEHDNLIAKGFEVVTPFNPFPVMHGQEIQVSVTCDSPKGVTFSPEKRVFHVDEKFMEEKKPCVFDFEIGPVVYHSLLGLSCNIYSKSKPLQIWPVNYMFNHI